MAAWSTVITLASIMYQQSEQRRLRAQAQDQANAQKGQFLAVDGQIVALPIVYGRQVVSGVRVYHETSDKYTYSPEGATDSLDVFMSGRAEGSTYKTPINDTFDPADTTMWRDPETGKVFRVSKAGGGTTMDASREGGFHEFLMVQQALCIGPIHKCHDVIIDDKTYTDNEFAASGLLVNVHRNGGVSAMISANAPVSDNRDRAGFPMCAHASMVFRLNRDDPQYSGVPNCSFLIEGRLIRVFDSGGNLSTSRQYSNNPALCLLDYLLDDVFGRGLREDELDLASFKRAADVCNRRTPSVQIKKGRIWQTPRPVSQGGRNVTETTYGIFEANIVIDTAKSVRDNVRALLSTMGDARLIWSGGVYKLALNYPQAGASIEPCVTITDDLLLKETLSVQWPGIETRKSLATVRFANEQLDFKEDAVVWPPKYKTVHQAFLEQDKGIRLEVEVDGTGVTTRIHAYARAEAAVRSSRDAVVLTFSAMIRGAFLEPGDIIRLDSESAGFGGDEAILLQLDEITMDDRGAAAIKATRFNPALLAWNANDEWDGSSGAASSNGLPPPLNFKYVPADAILNGAVVNTSGDLTWTSPGDARVTGYRIYYGKASEVDAVTNPSNKLVSVNKAKLIELQTIKGSPCKLPLLVKADYVFGIRSVSQYGNVSEMLLTSTLIEVVEKALPPPSMRPDADESSMGTLTVHWVLPQFTPEELPRYSSTQLWRNTTGAAPLVLSNGVVEGATLVGSVQGTMFRDIGLESNVPHYYWGRNVTKLGRVGAFSGNFAKGTPYISVMAMLKVLNADYLQSLTEADLVRGIVWAKDAEKTLADMKPAIDGVQERATEMFNRITEGVVDIKVNGAGTATTLQGLKASAGQNTAQIGTLRETFTTYETATAQTLESLRATAGTAAADATESLRLIASNNTATATRIDNLSAKVGTVAPGSPSLAAQIQLVESATVDMVNPSSLVRRQEALTTRLENTDKKVDTKVNAEAVEDLILKSTNTGIIAERVSTLQASVDSKSSTIISDTAPVDNPAKPFKKGDVWLQPKVTKDQNGADVATSTQYVWFPGAGWALAPDTLAVDAFAGVKQIETSQIGYCMIGGYPGDQTNRKACETAGGTWMQGLPIAQLMNQAKVEYNGLTASTQVAMTALFNSATHYYSAYTVKLDANGTVSGFSSYADPSGSAFVVNADKFYVGSTNNLAFAVLTAPQTINGTTLKPGVYARNAFIQDLQIDMGKIGPNVLPGMAVVSAYVGWGGTSVSIPCGPRAKYVIATVHPASLLLKGNLADGGEEVTFVTFNVTGNGPVSGGAVTIGIDTSVQKFDTSATGVRYGWNVIVSALVVYG